MEIFLAFIIGVVMGIVLSFIAKKKDGRMIIDGDDYFVAISTPPSDLAKRKWINLKVIVRWRDEERAHK